MLKISVPAVQHCLQKTRSDTIFLRFFEKVKALQLRPTSQTYFPPEDRMALRRHTRPQRHPPRPTMTATMDQQDVVRIQIMNDYYLETLVDLRSYKDGKGFGKRFAADANKFTGIIDVRRSGRKTHYSAATLAMETGPRSDRY